MQKAAWIVKSILYVGSTCIPVIKHRYFICINSHDFRLSILQPINYFLYFIHDIWTQFAEIFLPNFKTYQNRTSLILTHLLFHELEMLNPIALRKTKIAHNFGLSECNRVKYM